MRFIKCLFVFVIVVTLPAVWASGTSELMDAVHAGDIEQVREFIDAGHDVNVTDAEGNTGLHSAAAADRQTIARILIDAGAEVDAQNAEGRTPLHIASGSGHLGMVLMLTCSGADIHLVDNSGERAMLFALEGRHLTIAEVLSALDFEEMQPRDPTAVAEEERSNERVKRLDEIFDLNEDELTEKDLEFVREAYGYGDEISDDEVRDTIAEVRQTTAIMSGEEDLPEQSGFVDRIGTESYPSVDWQDGRAALLRWDFSVPRNVVYTYEQEAKGGLFSGMIDGNVGTMTVTSDGEGTADFVMYLDDSMGEDEDDGLFSGLMNQVMALQGMQGDSRVPGLAAGQQLYLDLLWPLPGGELKVGETSTVETKMQFNVYGSLLWVKGAIRLTFDDVVSIDGHRCAKLLVEIDVSDLDIPEGIDDDYYAFVKGSGILYFDLEDRCFHSGEIAQVMAMRADLTMFLDSLMTYRRDRNLEIQMSAD